MKQTEQDLRKELAALYRVVEHFRMSDLIFTHISARVPGPEDHFLINRYGTMFREMTPASLAKVNLDGELVDLADRAGNVTINPAGFTIHSAIHAARPDVGCIIHTHTMAGMAVAALECGLLPITQHAMKFYNRIAYHSYEGIALDLDERERLVKDLGHHNAMILRNHGLLVTGGGVAEAFDQIYFLERACQAQIATQSAGLPLSFPGPEVCEHAARQFESEGRAPWIEPAWQAAKRLLDLPSEHGF